MAAVSPVPRRFVEFFGPQRDRAARALRLVRVGTGRGGYAFGVGFPVSLRDLYLARAVRAGYGVADVRETGRIDARCAARVVVAVWIPGEGRGIGAGETHR